MGESEVKLFIEKHYTINYEKQIGRGSTGCVYEATRLSDGRLVAVKVIPRSSLSNADTITLICNEVNALRMLSHPHVVKLYDIFEDSEKFYLAMELITGGELFERLSKKTKYSEGDARTLCSIILSAVKHCHDKDICHRDLKPENLMMASEESDTDVRLVDFGFAKKVDGDSLSSLIGTRLYMAPEIWRREKYGKSVDIWSFGVIAYILLCGYPPFYHSDPLTLINAVKKGEFEFHEQHWSLISEEAKDFVCQCLILDTSKRATVDALLNHRWICGDMKKDTDLTDNLERLRQFNAKRDFKKAIIAVIAIGRMKFGSRQISKAPLEEEVDYGVDRDCHLIPVCSSINIDEKECEQSLEHMSESFLNVPLLSSSENNNPNRDQVKKNLGRSGSQIPMIQRQASLIFLRELVTLFRQQTSHSCQLDSTHSPLSSQNSLGSLSPLKLCPQKSASSYGCTTISTNSGSRIISESSSFKENTFDEFGSDDLNTAAPRLSSMKRFLSDHSQPPPLLSTLSQDSHESEVQWTALPPSLSLLSNSSSNSFLSTNDCQNESLFEKNNFEENKKKRIKTA